jgi:luciferase family oxidoreductase group 1
LKEFLLNALPVSVLDLTVVDSGSSGPQALRNTIEIAKRAEALGYHRIWLAEHHNTSGIASPAPEIMLGVLARETSEIRLGSGGIMLPNHSPLKVAEVFRVLEALAPNRVDLGIGRAPGTDTMTALALRRSREALSADDFPEQIAEMRGYNTLSESDHPFMRIKATPIDVPLPPVWILGSSDYGARLAAANGFPFSFAAHINMKMAIPAMRYYRDHYQPSEAFPEPVAMLALSVITADSEEQIEILKKTSELSWIQLITGRHGPVPHPDVAMAYEFSEEENAQLADVRARRIAGLPHQIKDRIMEIVEATSADEVMLASMVWGHHNRMRSLELMAEQFNLTPRNVAFAR